MKHFLFALLFCQAAAISAQEFYDLSTIQTIEITFAESNWDQLLDNAYANTGDYIMAQAVTINGVTFDSVGVKYKGNSTYQANQTKNPFHIELDTYKDQEYDGFTDVKLSNVAKDPSFLREVLSYQILRQYADAPLSNYANVWVNGQLIGLYSNSESISRKFVDKHFGSKDNARIKCNPPDGAGPQSRDLPNLVYLGQDSTDYYAAYELKSDAGWQELINLCDTLANATEAIDKILDVDRVLWMLAFNNALVNLDSYSGRFAQNYYLYRDDYGRFLATVWDLNESFGVFSDSGTIRFGTTTQKAQMSPLLHENDADYPLISKLLAIPEYRRKYLAHLKTMIEENFVDGSYEETALELQNLIDGSVQSDQNKFFTYNQFLSNLNADISSGGGPGGGSQTPGITNLMNARATYLLGQTELAQTGPSIAVPEFSDSSPALGQAVTVTTTVANAARVYLNFRTAAGAPFAQLIMFDDGTHGDGAAGDGVFGLEITLDAPYTEYYIYAENDAIGKFSPQRAEHEFYSINAGSTSTLMGDLVINEFLASNDQVQADQDGEFDDWIELYNNSGSAIDLSSFYLSDDVTNGSKWTFPAGTSISANGYLIVWADDDEEQEGLHASFKLSAGGEAVILSDAAGAVIDSLTYPEQETDVSYGRYPNGTGTFREMLPTFEGENNEGTTSAVNPTTLGISLTLFPNPTATNLDLSLDQAYPNELNANLYSSQGRRVLSDVIPQGVTRTTLNTNSLPPGLYYLRLSNGQAVVTHKVVLSR